MSETIGDIGPQNRDRRLYGWCLHHTNVYKIFRLYGATSLLVVILSLSNLATLLILRRSLQRCQIDFCYLDHVKS